MYTKKMLAALCGLAMVSMVGCGGTEEAPGDGNLTVSVTQALSFGDVDTIRVQVNGQGGTWAQHDLHRNGNIWTTVIGGVPYGTYTIVAQALELNGANDADDEVLFQGQDQVVVGPDSRAPHANLLMQQTYPHDGHANTAPVFHSVTVSNVAVNGGEGVMVRVGAKELDGEELSLAGEGLFGTYGAASPFTAADAQGVRYASFTWTAPVTEDLYELGLAVTDAAGNTSRMKVNVRVGTNTGRVFADFNVNMAPTIADITADDGQDNHSVVALAYSVADPDYREGPLSFAWTKLGDCAGSFEPASGIFAVAPNGTASGTAQFTLTGRGTGPTCAFQLTVTDKWNAATTGTIAIDTTAITPMYVPNLLVDLQTHTQVGYVAADPYRLEFGVFADGIPDSPDFHIAFEWWIGDYAVPYLAWNNWATFEWELDLPENLALSYMHWTATTPVACRHEAAASFIDVKVRATANGVSDEIVFPVEVLDVTALCSNAPPAP